MNEQGNSGMRASEGPVLFSAHPVPMSFLHRYLLCGVPVLLVFLTIVITGMLTILTEAGTRMVTSSVGSLPVSGMVAADNAGIAQSLTLGLGEIPMIGVLLIAPVGIFIIVFAIGWMLRITELWAGTALALGLSALMAGAITLVIGTHSHSLLLYFLKWTAFLIQLSAVLATIVMLFWLDRFRNSIRYAITDRAIIIRGGIGTVQEHQLPLARVKSVVLEEGFLGTRYGFGTVIPVISSREDTETSQKESKAGDKKDRGPGKTLFAANREEASRAPLDCLFGIPDPAEAQKIILERITQPIPRLEE